MGPFSSNARFNALEYDLRKERASALGAAGRKVQEALEALRNAPAADKEKLMYAAADCVWRYFVHREACGARDHQDAIAEYGIPQQVLARVGARAPQQL